MSGFHLLKPSWSLGATATSANEATADTVANNLMNSQPSYKYRSNNLTTVRITIDAGEPLPWNGLCLLYHNGSSVGQLWVTSHDSTGALFTTPDFDVTVPLQFSGDLSSFDENHTWVHTLTTQTYRYIGLEILDSTNPDGYFQAGVVSIGNVFTPRIGADLGARMGFDDPSPLTRLVTGEAFTRAKRGYMVATWQFPKQQESDAVEWRRINRVYGSNVPMVAKWDPVNSNYQQETLFYGIGQWRRGGAIVYSNGAGLHDVEFGIEGI